MNAHPGGEEHTRRMLEAAALPKGAKILDMGAGAGETVALLHSLGYECIGIDLAPRADFVQQGDFLCTGYSENLFDVVISQCAFIVSGNAPQAMREAHRVLKKGGLLLLSDVFFDDPVRMLCDAAFEPVYQEDLTGQWREYYLEALWREDECSCPISAGKCTYRFIIGRKC